MITNIFNENISTSLDEWHGQSYPLIVKREKARRGWFGMEVSNNKNCSRGKNCDILIILYTNLSTLTKMCRDILEFQDIPTLNKNLSGQGGWSLLPK